VLEVTRVSKDYQTPSGPIRVLSDIDLSVGPGQSISIVGPSGSGKSTLLNIMGALDRPTEGTVRLDGRDLAQMSDGELAEVRNRRIGFVFQLHHLLPQCTVLENVLTPALAANRRVPEAVCKRARMLLDRVGLSSHLEHRPGQLSGGERQRTVLARALVNSPSILLADEPTGSLDRASAEGLADLLVELNRQDGIAMVVVTHWRTLAERLGKTLELRDGALVPGNQ